MSLNHFLEALEYPSAASFQFTSRNDLVNLVSWLEDRKIRALEIGERNTIRCNNEDWSDNFERYLQSLECPFSWSEGAADCVAWLVSHAINLEYEDIADTVNEADETHQGGFLPQEKAPMEQDDMDGLDEGISLEIDSLGATIGLDRYKLESDSGSCVSLNILTFKVKKY